MLSNRTEDICPAVCTLAEFGRLIGVSRRTVSDLKLRGDLVMENGKVLAQESLHRYLAGLTKRAEARNGTGGFNLANERAKLTVVKRSRLELELEAMSQEVITHAEVSEGWERLSASVRNGINVLAPGIKAALPHLTHHDHCVAADAIEDMRRRIADETEPSTVPGSTGRHGFMPTKGTR